MTRVKKESLRFKIAFHCRNLSDNETWSSRRWTLLPSHHHLRDDRFLRDQQDEHPVLPGEQWRDRAKPTKNNSIVPGRAAWQQSEGWWRWRGWRGECYLLLMSVFLCNRLFVLSSLFLEHLQKNEKKNDFFVLTKQFMRSWTHLNHFLLCGSVIPPYLPRRHLWFSLCCLPDDVTLVNKFIAT